MGKRMVNSRLVSKIGELPLSKPGFQQLINECTRHLTFFATLFLPITVQKFLQQSLFP